MLQMELAIQHSNNAATNWMLRKIGGPKAAERILKRQDPGIFQDTRIVEHIPRGGRTYRSKASPHDYSRFLYAVWKEDIFGAREIKRLMGLPSPNRILSFLPNLFLAVVIVALGAWVGGLAGKFARAFAMAARIQEANLLGKGVQYLVIVIALGTALEQLNVATRFLFGAFLIVLGSLGLAFGLGGQEKAREILRRISRLDEKEEP